MAEYIRDEYQNQIKVTEVLTRLNALQNTMEAAIKELELFLPLAALNDQVTSRLQKEMNEK